MAAYPEHARTRHALILSADAALYSAKDRGRNRSVAYDETCSRLCHVGPTHMKALLPNDEMAAIEALAAVIDGRDHFMRGHSHAVMEVVPRDRREAGHDQRRVDVLRNAALLHDVGKIGTPEAVLEKNAPLDANERQQIQNHAGLGSQILKRMQQTGAILPGVKHHHERYDGKATRAAYRQEHSAARADHRHCGHLRRDD